MRLRTLILIQILRGGVWTKITDKFLVAAGTTYTGTGGSATDSITLQEANLPSHTHTFSGSEHSHSYTPSGSISGGSYSFSGNTATGYLTVPYVADGNDNGWNGGVFRANGSRNGTIRSGSDVARSRLDFSMTPSGSVSVSSNPSFSGSAATLKATQGGTIGSTGSGTAFTVDTIPPYQAVYIWERTA